VKAKRYCESPYEVRHDGPRKHRVAIHGERIGETRSGARREVSLRCGSATRAALEPNSLDAVFTDPPYLGNVQYGELMDFCYVWLRRLVGDQAEGFDRLSTRSPDELTSNATQGRGLEHFTEGLSAVYSRMARALKPGAPLAFTYHHNQLEAYYAVGVALLDAGLVCTASLPCPAEMGGSIHIHGTKSSIIDTVFVCRTSGAAPENWLFNTPERLIEIVGEAATRVSEPARRRLPEMPWERIVGMRNRLVHAYFDVNLDIVWKTVREDLPALIALLESAIPPDPPEAPPSRGTSPASSGGASHIPGSSGCVAVGSAGPPLSAPDASARTMPGGGPPAFTSHLPGSTA